MARYIINAEPEEAPAVLAKMLEVQSDFSRVPSRLGWGWHYHMDGKRWFICEIKGGLSARPVVDPHLHLKGE